MKSILLGNGIDIQFGGKAYTNRFILERIIFNAKTDKYDKLFENTISGDDIENIFKGFINTANDIIKGKYDSITNKEMAEAVTDFKKRYLSDYVFKNYYDIPLEDWFLLIGLFFEENKDISHMYNASKQGFERMILDAIYNDGDIQKLYLKMGKKVKKYFKTFDNIFTLNYDNNIESLCGEKVYHLHGDYSKLADCENPNMVQGFCRKESNNTALISGFEHCYCNALLNYSGAQKLKQADANKTLIGILTRVKSEILNGDYNYKTEFESVITLHPEISEWFEAYAHHDNLEICSDYYFDKFKALKGELHILGLSPQNDSHIFECIDNSGIDRVIFYYYGDKPTSLNLQKKVEFRKASDLWKMLDANNPRYNINVSLPNGSSEIIECINKLSFDRITNEELIKELKNYPEFLAKPLCEEAKTLMADLDSLGSPKDEKEFIKRFMELSKFALRKGIYPTALYLMVVQSYNK